MGFVSVEVPSSTVVASAGYWADDSNWLLRLLVNLLGYATIIGPGALLICYVRRTKCLENQVGPVSRVLRLLVLGHEQESSSKPSLELGGRTESPRPARSLLSEAFVLAYCFLGLQVSYLTWGVLQEKIMTQRYYTVMPSSPLEDGGQRFGDSQFLVFVNRVLAFTLSGLYLLLSQQPRHVAPVYKYSYCSFSNIMSSWCQYEALKFVAFPTQVLAKASKVIPVMLMGKLVSRKSYEWHEYLLALAISLGMGLFLFSRSSGSDSAAASSPSAAAASSSLSGLVILVGYLLLDSFTSNWQSELFRTYRMSSAQMMCGVNFFSCLFTLVSLLQQGALAASVHFMFRYHAFFYDCLLLSLCSATGQLFVFHTIAQFGPVVFVVAMTVRQAVAVLLSCLIYGHRLGTLGIAGVLVVFGAVFAKIYMRQRAG